MNSRGYARIARSQINNDHINSKGEMIRGHENHWNWKEVKKWNDEKKEFE
jgi:hypothetical protein